MDLPKVFYVRCDKQVYSCVQAEGGRVTLCWRDNSGEHKSDHYGIAEVKMFLLEGVWALTDEQGALIKSQSESSGSIKSDGGSSSYYDIKLPNWLVALLIERRGEGGAFIKTEELIEVLGSDFDVGNILKCLIRINSLKNGCGKKGNDVTYDASKIKYSANRLIEREVNK